MGGKLLLILLIIPSTAVRDLGIYIDSDLSM